MLLALFLQTNMSKSISVIVHNSKIVSSFTCRDAAVREFKKMEVSDGEISLHFLDRPDRKKKATKGSEVRMGSVLKNPSKNIERFS